MLSDFKTNSIRCLHDAVLDQARALSNPPHVIIYGTAGSGKYTRARLWAACVMKAPATEKLLKTTWALKIPGKTVAFNVWTCNSHIVINPTVFGTNDKHVLRQFIDAICNTGNVKACISNTNLDFKLVIVTNAECLSKPAQHSLKCVMESSIQNVRFVLLSRQLSKIIDPVNSRCLKIKVVADRRQMEHIASQVCCHNTPGSSQQQVAKIVDNCNGSWRKFWNCMYRHNDLTWHSLPLHETSTEASVLDDIVTSVYSPSLPRIDDARVCIYRLLGWAITPSSIVRELCARCSVRGNIDIMDLVNVACEADERCRGGIRVVLHLEWFVTKLMCLIGGSTA